MKRWLAAALLAMTGSGVAWGATPLVDAAASNNQAVVQSLLQSGADINEKGWDGSTALLWAVVNQNGALVQQLIGAGADVAAANNHGAFPLREAVDRGNATIVEALLRAGANVESATGNNPTMLVRAAAFGYGDVARVLLQHGANPQAESNSYPVLVWAVTHRSADVARVLIEFGADVNWATASTNASATRPFTHGAVNVEPRIQYGNLEGRGGYTVTMLAAREGCAACIPLLKAAGADLDRGDPNGVTPLILAATNMNYDTVIALVENGADPNLWDWWGRAPLYSVVDVLTTPIGGHVDRPNIVDQYRGIDAVAALLEAGADPNFQLKQRPPFRAVGADRGCDQLLVRGATPLIRAAKTHNVDAVRLLLEYGAIVDLPQLVGITPLMAAAGGGSWDCDPRGGSLAPGAARNPVDAFLLVGGGITMEQRSIATIQLLLEAGANINAQAFGPFGDFPEYRIRFENNGFDRETMRALRALPLEELNEWQAANGEFSNRDGQTALHWAAFWGWNYVVEFLAQNGADLLAKDNRGMTPIDAALGRAGGNGFGGGNYNVLPETAALLERLIAEKGLQIAAVTK